MHTFNNNKYYNVILLYFSEATKITIIVKNNCILYVSLTYKYLFIRYNLCL